MKYRKDEATGVVIVDIENDLNTENVFQISDLLIELIDKDNINIILNLEKTNYICSKGIGILAYAYAKTAKKGGSLKLCKATEIIKKLLRITRLEQLFEAYENIDAALESFKK